MCIAYACIFLRAILFSLGYLGDLCHFTRLLADLIACVNYTSDAGCRRLVVSFTKSMTWPRKVCVIELLQNRHDDAPDPSTYSTSSFNYSFQHLPYRTHWDVCVWAEYWCARAHMHEHQDYFSLRKLNAKYESENHLIKYDNFINKKTTQNPWTGIKDHRV